MADRAVRVRLEANVDGFRSAMSTAAKSVNDFDKKTQGYIQANKASINDLSNTALGLGAGFIAASGLAAKAAMDWESAWTGVLKTVDGTDEQLSRLEEDLRSMARELPATHQEIAAVAEAAGQLGIATDDVADFTRTMIDLGVSTDLAAEDAAMALARFMTITGTANSDVDKLGAAVVGLGNNFAATESEIVTLATRLAGAGAQAGLSEGDILGMAAAMSQVGIEAEAGGSAMSLTMKRIGSAVEEGGDSLGMFAQVSGMTAEEFATAWQTRPAEALDAFITGLSETEQMGMSTNAVLKELGVTGIRESDSLLRLSAAAGVTADAMAMGNEEFEKGTALAEEAMQFYQTAENQIGKARNAFVDLAIDVGGQVAPAISDAAETVSYLIEKFQELPQFAKGALGMGAGAAGLALVAVGSLGRAATAVSDLRLTMGKLGIATDTTSRKLKLLGVGSAAALAVTGLAYAITHFVGEAAEARALTDSLADSFDDLTGAATAQTDQTILDHLSDTLKTGDWDKLQELGISYEEVFEAIKEGGPAVEELQTKINDLGIEHSGLSAEAWQTRATLNRLNEGVMEASGSYVDATVEARNHREATAEVGDASEMSAEQVSILEAEVERTGVKLDGTIESLKEFTDLLFEAGLLTMSAREAQSAYQESLVEQDAALEEIIEDMGGLSAALNENKTDFDLTTEAGRTANSAFQDIAKSGMDATSAMADNNATQEELQANLNTTYEDLVAAAEEFGITGDAAHDLAREIMGIPEDVDIETWMDDQAQRQAEQTKSAIDNIPRRVRVSATLTYYEGEIPSGVKRGPGENIAGFAGGGYTGDGGKFEPKGVVHGGEWVTTKERTAKYRPVLESIHRGTYPLPGYANGGEVGASYIPANKVIDLNYQFSAPVGGGGTTVNNQFHNYNTDAVRATQQQVAQFSQKIGAMPVGVPG